MDRYSILDLGPAEPVDQLRPNEPVRTGREEKPRGAEELRFPGEDGGESLATWAQRDLEATLQLLTDRAQYITGASGAAIALHEGEHIVCRASAGPSAPGVGSYLQADSGLSGESVRSRKTLRCDDAEKDPRVNHESCRDLGIASFVVMPLIRGQEVIGIFEIFSGQANSFEERDILALERMGDMVNTALDQVRGTWVGSAPAGTDGGVAGSQAVSAKPAVVEAKPEPVGPQEVPAKPAGLHGNLVHSWARVVPKAPEPKGSEPKGFPSEPATSAKVPEEVSAPAAQETTGGNQAATERGTRVCSSCGFPVSEGRTLCLDCEAAAAENQPAESLAATSEVPAFLTDLELGGQTSEPSGLKHWVISHKYVIGTVVVLVSSLVLLLTAAALFGTPAH